MIAPWKVTQSETLLDCRVFKVRKDVTVNPRTGQAHDMYVLENPTWVNIVPLTPRNEVILVEQWRHGTGTVHLETPGGLVDDGESPEQCARRELIEETGYAADTLAPLGQVHPNPAIQSNVLHYLLATGCRPVAKPALDHAEDIAVHVVPLTDIPSMIQSGRITHSLVIGAFYWLELRQKIQ